MRTPRVRQIGRKPICTPERSAGAPKGRAPGMARVTKRAAFWNEPRSGEARRVETALRLLRFNPRLGLTRKPPVRKIGRKPICTAQRSAGAPKARAPGMARVDPPPFRSPPIRVFVQQTRTPLICQTAGHGCSSRCFSRMRRVILPAKSLSDSLCSCIFDSVFFYAQHIFLSGFL